MKKSNILLKVIYVIFIITTSCDNDNFLDVKPFNETIPEDTDDLAMILNDSRVKTGSCNYLFETDDLSPNLREDKVINNLYTYRDYFYDPSSNSDNSWVINYKIISYANYVLEYIDKLPKPKDNEYEVNNTKGRALFLRANSYFILISEYAKNYDEDTSSKDMGVPLTYRMDIGDQLPRSTVKEVYDLIIKDLNQAVDLIDNESKHPGYWASKVSCYALLGRVYLFQKKYDKSIENCKKALELSDYLVDYNEISFKDKDRETPVLSGLDGYDEIESKTDGEHLFNLFFTGGEYGNQYSLMTFSYSKKLIDKFNKNKDLRFRYFMYDEGYQFVPYNDLIESKNYNSGITTPELYLNYCESLIKSDNPKIQESLLWLNKFRKNRYDSSSYKPYTSSNRSDILKEIMLERRRELRFSLIRWLDMKRLGVECTHELNGKTYTIKATSNNYVWAIPRYVISLNPNLKQNPRGL